MTATLFLMLVTAPMPCSLPGQASELMPRPSRQTTALGPRADGVHVAVVWDESTAFHGRGRMARVHPSALACTAILCRAAWVWLQCAQLTGLCCARQPVPPPACGCQSKPGCSAGAACTPCQASRVWPSLHSHLLALLQQEPPEPRQGDRAHPATSDTPAVLCLCPLSAARRCSTLLSLAVQFLECTAQQPLLCCS